MFINGLIKQARYAKEIRLTWLTKDNVSVIQSSLMVSYTSLHRDITCNVVLLTECSFVITPTGEPDTQRLTLNIMKKINSLTVLTATRKNMVATATAIFKETADYVNGSVCHISSLEVYRGSEQAIEINHGGFSLDDNGTIKVYN